MRALSVKQAAGCETAKNKTCHCRCGGVLHGAKRNTVEGMGNLQEKLERAYYEALPADDPHHLPTAAEIKQRRKLARQKLLKNQFQYRIFEEQ